MDGGKCECAGNGKEKMGSAKKEGWAFVLFFILPIKKEKPNGKSLERVGKMDGDEMCLVEADKDVKAGSEEKEGA